jgi:hypothetical protein
MSALIPAPAPAPASVADARSRLVTAIRAFVHTDNLAEVHARQATNAREARARHEAEAIALMRELRMEASTLQISGASLSLVHQKTPGTLTWGYLEREIPAWATHSGVSAAQAASLLRWLRDHRDIKETDHLKKSVAKTPGAAPAQ